MSREEEGAEVCAGTVEPEPPVRERPRRRMLWVGVLALVVAVGASSWGLRRARDRRIAEQLPVFGSIPEFQLTDQNASPFSSANLRGHVVVADFFFTRCTTVCPVLTARMSRVQREARNQGIDLRFVSISVDPHYDTPARLAEYARTRVIDTRNWTLLTGPIESIEPVVIDGFRVMMGRTPDAGDDDFLSVFHGDHFVLVDGEGRIRGYYSVVDGAEGLSLLLRDAAALARSSG